MGMPKMAQALGSDRVADHPLHSQITLSLTHITLYIPFCAMHSVFDTFFHMREHSIHRFSLQLKRKGSRSCLAHGAGPACILLEPQLSACRYIAHTCHDRANGALLG